MVQLSKPIEAWRTGMQVLPTFQPGGAMGPRHRGEEGNHIYLWVYLWCAPHMREERYIAVYIMASQRLGTLYIGASGYLHRRIWEHREGLVPGFTRTYGLKRLVWYEPHEDMSVAFQRERSLKRWPRQWKINLVERENPDWDDLYEGLV